MKTLLCLICLALSSSAFLVCMNSAPISRPTLRIFSTLMGLQCTPSPGPPPVLSKDKLLTSAKAFLINKGICRGMSPGLRGLLSKGGGEPGRTSLLVHLSGQWATSTPECPWQGHTHPPTLSPCPPRRSQCRARGRRRGKGSG